MLVEVTQPKGISSILDIKAFGTAEHLFRVTAWILKFISNTKAKVKKGKHCRSTSDLNVVELEEAECGSRKLRQCLKGMNRMNRCATVRTNSLFRYLLVLLYLEYLL